MLDNFLRAYKSDQTHIKSVYQLAKTFALLRKEIRQDYLQTKDCC